MLKLDQRFAPVTTIGRPKLSLPQPLTVTNTTPKVRGKLRGSPSGRFLNSDPIRHPYLGDYETTLAQEALSRNHITVPPPP